MPSPSFATEPTIPRNMAVAELRVALSSTEGFAKALVERLGGTLRRDVVASLEITITESDGQGGSYIWSWDTGHA
jgi:hypothetical protein